MAVDSRWWFLGRWRTASASIHIGLYTKELVRYENAILVHNIYTLMVTMDSEEYSIYFFIHHFLYFMALVVNFIYVFIPHNTFEI